MASDMAVDLFVCVFDLCYSFLRSTDLPVRAAFDTWGNTTMIRSISICRNPLVCIYVTDIHLLVYSCNLPDEAAKVRLSMTLGKSNGLVATHWTSASLCSIKAQRRSENAFQKWSFYERLVHICQQMFILLLLFWISPPGILETSRVWWCWAKSTSLTWHPETSRIFYTKWKESAGSKLDCI